MLLKFFFLLCGAGLVVILCRYIDGRRFAGPKRDHAVEQRVKASKALLKEVAFLRFRRLWQVFFLEYRPAVLEWRRFHPLYWTAFLVFKALVAFSVATASYGKWDFFRDAFLAVWALFLKALKAIWGFLAKDFSHASSLWLAKSSCHTSSRNGHLLVTGAPWSSLPGVSKERRDG